MSGNYPRKDENKGNAYNASFRSLNENGVNSQGENTVAEIFMRGSDGGSGVGVVTGGVGVGFAVSMGVHS
jgi:hypothetical protein